MKNGNLTLLALAILAIQACSTTQMASSPESAPLDTSARNIPYTASAEITDVGAASLAQLDEMKQKSVYFDFDKHSIKPEYREVIQQHGNFLKDSPSVSLTLEGNADERGSNEYNLALGHKRAESVRKTLELMGIDANRVKAVSYGEEKPRRNCHEEKCWMENRRVDFIGKQGS